jgi:5-methyltetrahydrofolate--homocysteine methyltransferase
VETTLSSARKTVTIGPGRPLVVIGERINPTGRKRLAAEMADGCFDRVQADAVAQVEAGAHMLDVNAGIPLADEPGLLSRAVALVQSVTDVPLSLDSAMPNALKAGLDVYEGKALVNSVTGEEARMEAVLPLVKAYDAAVVALLMDDEGIPATAEDRIRVAHAIVQRASDHGIPKEDIVIDPLVMPVGAVPDAGSVLLETLRRVRAELGLNTVCGASNVSFGLPNRQGINASFLAMTMSAGLTAAITNPLAEENRQAILAADLLLGHDEHCASWIRANRPKKS